MDLNRIGTHDIPAMILYLKDKPCTGFKGFFNKLFLKISGKATPKKLVEALEEALKKRKITIEKEAIPGIQAKINTMIENGPPSLKTGVDDLLHGKVTKIH